MSNQTQAQVLDDILPLAPLQEGLLFHALYDPEGPDPHVSQLVLGLEGAVDRTALYAAVQSLLRRHANLRAGFVHFVHEDVSRPVQVIPGEVSLPWEELDLSNVPAEEQTQRVTVWLDDDRARRFDMATPPLLRFTLIRLGPEQHRLVLTAHHILMDGWSTPVLVRELTALYRADGDAAGLPPVTPYRDYLSWVANQDVDAARQAWRSYLAGLEQGTQLVPGTSGAVTPRDEVWGELPESLTDELVAQIRSQGWTMNTVFQGVWGLLVGRMTGSDDVVFGQLGLGTPAGNPGYRDDGGVVYQHGARSHAVTAW